MATSNATQSEHGRGLSSAGKLCSAKARHVRSGTTSNSDHLIAACFCGRLRHARRVADGSKAVCRSGARQPQGDRSCAAVWIGLLADGELANAPGQAFGGGKLVQASAQPRTKLNGGFALADECISD